MVKSGVLNVYIKDISPRAAWIFKLIFEDLLSYQLILTNDVSIIMKGEYPALNYSEDEIPGIPRILPYGLLSEENIQEQQIEVKDYQGLKVFFNTEGEDLPFDPFSVAFYLVSRYEEHLPFEPDQHGRFSYNISLAHSEGFLQQALVNRLAYLLKELLIKHYPEARFVEKEYHFIPSIDIDIAFAHLGKGFVRTYGAMVKLLLKGNMAEIKSRILTMRGKTKDPYDNFNFIIEACNEYKLNPVFFVLAGEPGPNDRNLSTSNKKFALLLKDLSQKADIGIHPSYGSDNNEDILKKELGRLQSVIAKTIIKSRQHFVRLSFPQTYRMLISNNIKEDYSMGYADNTGFRASIASPYKYFILSENKETDLRVFPFMLMDTTMGDYLGLEPEQYLDAALPIIEEVKKYKGTLIGIWHNYAMADDKQKLDSFRELLNLAAAE